MRKWINGELVEGTPVEIAEYERIVSGKKTVRICADNDDVTAEWLRYAPVNISGVYPFTTFI